MKRTKKHQQQAQTIFHTMHSLKADSLTGFIAGFLVGIIGMYVYAIIITSAV